MNITNTNITPSPLPNYIPFVQYGKSFILDIIFVFIGFTVYICLLIYMSAGIKMEYVPNFNMFIDFIIDRTSYSSNRFIEYIKDIITTTKIQEQINGFTNYNESEAVENSPVENSPVENSHTLFNKIQTIINMFLIKYWYTNGNTINVKI